MKLIRGYAHVLLMEVEHEQRNVLGTLDTALGNIALGLEQAVVDREGAKKRVVRCQRQAKLIVEMNKALCSLTFEDDGKFHRESVLDILELAKEHAVRGENDGAAAARISIEVDPKIEFDARLARGARAWPRWVNCWVCGRPIEGGDQLVVAKELPGRRRAYEGTAIHLRCQGEWREGPPVASAARRAPPTPSRLPLGKHLYAEDIAELRGISRWQARRWLVFLEQVHGDRVVGRVPGRRGVRRFTMEAALRTVGPRTKGERDVP